MSDEISSENIYEVEKRLLKAFYEVNVVLFEDMYWTAKWPFGQPGFSFRLSQITNRWYSRFYIVIKEVSRFILDSSDSIHFMYKP